MSQANESTHNAQSRRPAWRPAPTFAPPVALQSGYRILVAPESCLPFTASRVETHGDDDGPPTFRFVCFQVIYTSFGGSSKGLHFNNLIVGLVLLTRGRDEEKSKCTLILLRLPRLPSHIFTVTPVTCL